VIFKPISLSTQQTTAHSHYNVGHRLSRLLHRLRQPTRRQRRQTERHSHMSGLRRIMQRYAPWQVTQAQNLSSHLADTSSKVVITHSKPDAFPSTLRSKRSEVQTITEEDQQTYAAVKEQCQRCGREEVKFYTQQVRGADEGTTVFYECDCGNKCVPLPLCSFFC